MIRRPPRSTLDRSSAASDVYKRQKLWCDIKTKKIKFIVRDEGDGFDWNTIPDPRTCERVQMENGRGVPVSYTHLRAHETVLDLVCRLLLEKNKTKKIIIKKKKSKQNQRTQRK